MSPSRPSIEDPEWRRASALLSDQITRLGLGRGRPRLVVLGVAFEASISHSRADLAPPAIRSQLHGFSTFDAASDAALDAAEWVDLGDVEVPDQVAHKASRVLVKRINDRLAGNLDASNDLLLVLGGDNAITHPCVGALGVPLQQVGVLTIDSHHDVRGFYAGATNANPIRRLIDDGLPASNVAQIGIGDFTNSASHRRWVEDHGVHVYPARSVFTDGAEAVGARALDAMPPGVTKLYIDVDMDALDAVYAPACPGARPGGLTPPDLLSLIRTLVADPRVQAVDFVEVDVGRDVRDLTARTAALAMLTAAGTFLARPTTPTAVPTP